METIPQLSAVETGKFLVMGKGDATFSTTSLDDVSGIAMIFLRHRK